MAQQFGIADPRNPNSLECIPRDAGGKSAGSLTATNVDLTLKQNSVSFGGYKASTKTINNAQYGMAGRPAADYEWADWSGSGSSGGIVKLRTKDGKIVCK